jgi:rubrerythrin
MIEAQTRPECKMTVKDLLGILSREHDKYKEVAIHSSDSWYQITHIYQDEAGNVCLCEDKIVDSAVRISHGDSCTIGELRESLEEISGDFAQSTSCYFVVGDSYYEITGRMVRKYFCNKCGHVQEDYATPDHCEECFKSDLNLLTSEDEMEASEEECYENSFILEVELKDAMVKGCSTGCIVFIVGIVVTIVLLMLGLD